MVFVVVIAEDGEGSKPAAEARKDRNNPVDRRVVIDQVAGEEDEVGLPLGR